MGCKGSQVRILSPRFWPASTGQNRAVEPLIMSFRASRRRVEKSVFNRFLRFVPPSTGRDSGRNDKGIFLRGILKLSYGIRAATNRKVFDIHRLNNRPDWGGGNAFGATRPVQTPRRFAVRLKKPAGLYPHHKLHNHLDCPDANPLADKLLATVKIQRLVRFFIKLGLVFRQFVFTNHVSDFLRIDVSGLAA